MKIKGKIIKSTKKNRRKINRIKLATQRSIKARRGKIHSAKAFCKRGVHKPLKRGGNGSGDGNSKLPLINEKK